MTAIGAELPMQLPGNYAGTCPKPDRQADLVLPGRSRSLVKIGRMLEAVESGQIVIDPECRLLLGDNRGEPSMRAIPDYARGLAGVAQAVDRA